MQFSNYNDMVYYLALSVLRLGTYLGTYVPMYTYVPTVV